MEMTAHTTLRAAAQMGPKAMINTADLLALLAEYDALVAAGQPKRKAAAKKTAGTAPDLPAWLPLEAWEAFLAMRVKIKKPATEYAQKLLLKKLADFMGSGLNPAAILEQSITSGWQDLYAPKDQQGVARGYDNATGRPVQVRSRREEQQAAANAEALARLGGIPMFDANTIDVEVNYVAG